MERSNEMDELLTALKKEIQQCLDDYPQEHAIDHMNAIIDDLREQAVEWCYEIDRRVHS